jgi:hypothetical protein|tara:strand:+ start:440 stop:868 length:429 start_codon:yes stop_codon:yes gene_type:complete
MSVLQGALYWASITNPNTTYEPVYSVNVVVDDATAADFEKRGFRIKQMDEGSALVVKRKVSGPNGMTRAAPKLFDKSKNEVDVSVGNGTIGKVQYKEWEVVRQGETYRGLDLQAVQILDLVSFNQAGDEFDVEESLAETDEL